MILINSKSSNVACTRVSRRHRVVAFCMLCSLTSESKLNSESRPRESRLPEERKLLLRLREFLWAVFLCSMVPCRFSISFSASDNSYFYCELGLILKLGVAGLSNLVSSS